MKKLLALLCLTPLASPAFAATAYFTGRQEMVQTVTYQSGWNCEYQYGGQTFWQVFIGMCPMTVEVQ
jgi:hypothetical protein